MLVPVIAPGVNEDQAGEILFYARSRMPVIRGVHFQPVSYFGRCSESKGSYRITIPKMLRLLEEQTGGWIHAGDFTGGGATNPYCTFQANYLRQKDGSMKLLAHGESRTSGLSEQARDFVARQWSGNGCGEEKTGESRCTEPPREEKLLLRGRNGKTDSGYFFSGQFSEGDPQKYAGGFRYAVPGRLESGTGPFTPVLYSGIRQPVWHGAFLHL